MEPLSQLLDVIYRYYPPGRSTDGQGYDDTPESKRQKEAARRGQVDYPRWETLLERLKQYRGIPIADRSMHLAAGWVDSAYSAMAYERGETRPGAMGLGFHVSLFGPYYAVHRRGQPWETDIAPIIERTILETYPYEPIPKEIGEVVVPDITLDTRQFGEVTVYEALLSTWSGCGAMQSREPLTGAVRRRSRDGS